MSERKSGGLFRNHAIAGVIVLTLVGFIFTEVIVGTAASLIFRCLGLPYEAAGSIASIVAAIIVILVWRKLNASRYRYRPDAGSFLQSLKFAAPIILVWVAIVVAYSICIGGIPFRMIGSSAIAMAFMAGFVEEIVFGEVATSYLARQWRDEGKVILMAIVPGLIFGLVHLGNLKSVETLPDTLGQVLICVFAGLFYAAIYLRCGNIWPLACVHTLHDIVVFRLRRASRALRFQDGLTR